MKDMVKITCYGKTETMERSKALDFYREAIACCEGSERDRYMTIFIGLMDGLAEVSDNC